jgi:hypothetical protein
MKVGQLVSLIFLLFIQKIISANHSPPTTSLLPSEDDFIKFHDARFQRARVMSESNCLVPFNSSNSHDPRTTLASHPNNNNSDPCVLFYIHFHKSGGTTICSMIQKEGYQGNRKLNCQAAPEYQHREYEFAIQHHLNFIAIESGVFAANLTSGSIIYMTTIRHPYDRIISHLHHEICQRNQVEAQLLMKTHHCDDLNVTTATLADFVLNPCFNASLSSFTSNFYMKKMTGCHNLSPCTEESLKIAIKKLEIMSVIMVTDTPEDYEKSGISSLTFIDSSPQVLHTLEFEVGDSLPEQLQKWN